MKSLLTKLLLMKSSLELELLPAQPGPVLQPGLELQPVLLLMSLPFILLAMLLLLGNKEPEHSAN